MAERLNAGSKEREARALAALTATEVSPWNKQGVEAKAEEIAARAKSDLAMIESATEAVARIRAALAVRNVQLGISERLAQADAANRRVKLYRELLEKQDVDMVRPEDMQHVPSTAGADETRDFLRLSAPSVTLAIADRALLEDLRAKLAHEQARAHALLDAVADANREKLELELDKDLVEIAGLAA
ncbi:MAG: hypothetical protein HYS35_04730 [Betaproteobacteria bacterium]|nr:hypothetical protein [Betaproteobacteria bacterium]